MLNEPFRYISVWHSFACHFLLIVCTTILRIDFRLNGIRSSGVLYINQQLFGATATDIIQMLLLVRICILHRYYQIIVVQFSRYLDRDLQITVNITRLSTLEEFSQVAPVGSSISSTCTYSIPYFRHFVKYFGRIFTGRYSRRFGGSPLWGLLSP